MKLLTSLRNRDYRLYYLGQLVSLNGTWMQTVAQSRLVYRLTGSSTMLGIVTFSALFPVGSLLSGLLADWISPTSVTIMFGLVMIAAALWYVTTQRKRVSASASENHSGIKDKRA